MAYETEENKTSAFDDVVKQAQENGRTEKGKPSSDVTDLKIILWGNGFQVGDDGAFRALADAGNQQFIEELKEGRVPSELRQQYPNGVAVGLEDRRTQDYVPPPPPKYISFSGAGTSMGAAAASTGGAVDLNATGGKPVVDEGKPKTQIQFRFHNGQRAAIEVNLDHKVSDLHTYIQFVAPVDGSYSLVAGFPPKPLNDPSATIESAGLLKASITQKLQ